MSTSHGATLRSADVADVAARGRAEQTPRTLLTGKQECVILRA